MSALRFFERFQKLLDVDWSNIGDGQYLKRAGTLINGGTPAGGGAAELPPGYLFGLTLLNNVGDATNDIDVAPGECRDVGDTTDMLLASVMTKRLDANWVVGTGQGGLDTGSIANTTYHVFLIKSGAGVVDVLFSASMSPTMPSGYTFRRRIGSIPRVSGTLVGFRQTGNAFQLVPTFQVVNTNTQPNTQVLYPLVYVPSGIKVKVVLNCLVSHASTSNVGIYIHDPDVADEYPDAASNPGMHLRAVTIGLTENGEVEVYTNTSGQIAVRSTNNATTFRAVVREWVDDLGRPTTGASSMVVESPTYPAGYLVGLTLSNNVTDAVNDIDIARGVCRDWLDTMSMALPELLTKSLDANWVAGTNQGGLDTGAIANSTYHVYLIKRSDTGVVDVLFSLSASAPTLPVNYSHFRRIGSIVRAGGTILAFKQVGNYFQWVTPLLDVNVANQSTASINYSLSIPTGFKFLCRVNATLTHATFASLVLRDPETTDAAASAATAPLSSLNMPNSGAAITGQFDLMTNTSGQIAARSSASNTTVRLVALGWFDYRDIPGGGGTGTVAVTGGNVVGPVSAVDNHAAIFDGASGKIIKSAGYRASGVLLSNTALTTTSGAGGAEVLVWTFDVLPDLLAKDGDALRIVIMNFTNAASGSKQLRVRLGGQVGLLLNNNATVVTYYSTMIYIIRVSANSQRWMMLRNADTNFGTSERFDGTADLSVINALSIHLQATSSGISNHASSVLEFLPAP